MYAWNNPMRYICRGAERQAVLAALKREDRAISMRMAWRQRSLNVQSEWQSTRMEQGVTPLLSAEECTLMGSCGLGDGSIIYNDDFADVGSNAPDAAIEARYQTYRGLLRWHKSLGVVRESEVSPQQWSESKPMVMLSRKVYEDIYQKFQDILESSDTPYEIGGRLRVLRDVSPTETGSHIQLFKEDVVKGEKQSLTIGGRPEAPNLANIYEWHIHPNKCIVGRPCGLGWPSPADLENIIRRGAENGNVAHLVFSFEGVYVAFINPQFQPADTASRLQAMGSIREELQKNVTDKVVSGQLGSGLKGAIPVWLRTVNSPSSPVRVLFFALQVGPMLPPMDAFRQ